MAAPKGNQYTRKWYPEDLEKVFFKAYDYALENNDCLHLADATYHAGIPHSTYDYYADKDKVLGRIKKDTMTMIARRINRGALNGDFKETSSIWRMKQLGEKDKSEVKQTGDYNLTVKTNNKEEEDILNDIG